MGRQDEIRNALYGGVEGEIRKKRMEKLVKVLLTGRDEMPFVIEKRLVISLLVEAAVLAVIFLFPHAVAGYLLSFSEAVVPGWFGLGYMICSAAYMWLKAEVLPGDDVPIESGVISGHYIYKTLLGKFIPYAVGTAGGILNLFILVVLFILLCVPA